MRSRMSNLKDTGGTDSESQIPQSSGSLFWQARCTDEIITSTTRPYAGGIGKRNKRSNLIVKTDKSGAEASRSNVVRDIIYYFRDKAPSKQG